MKKSAFRTIAGAMLAGALLLAGTSAHAMTCPAGEHAVCRGGSGRGGGYHTTCTCVQNAPPVCVTAWGTQIPEGTSVILYDTNIVYAPDTCTAHGTVVSCSLTGVLDPPGATGYPVCNVITPDD
jgi:hypothetical protein